MKKHTLTFLLYICTQSIFAQQFKIDSLKQLLIQSKKDTNRVLTLGKLAAEYYYYHPDSTYYYAYQGMLLAQELRYKRGERRNLLEMGYGLSQMGNYPKALDILLRSLKLSEQIPYDYEVQETFSALGEVYLNEKDYEKSIEYNYKALAIAQNPGHAEDIISSMENLGIAYAERGTLDSALYFLNKVNEAYNKANDKQDIARIKINLAEVYVKLKKDRIALELYRQAMPFITENKFSEALCEVTFYMAGIFQRLNLSDSAIYYGKQSLAFARTSYFTSRQLQASDFLASFYESKKNADSTLKYLKFAATLKDSIFNQEKLRTIQNLTFDENIRQQELASQKMKAEENHVRNLQLLAIGIFIPIFFLMVLFLGRTKVRARVVEFLGILSLLLFFEFITDLIYPYVSEFTNDRPVWEMLILVVIASLLEPLNHKLEHWVKEHLVHKPVHVPVQVMVESNSNDAE